MASGLFRRMRALACRYWSCSPPELDDWIAEGRVTLFDVIELVHLLAHDPVVALWVMDYIFPEAKERRAQEEEEAALRKQREQWNLTALKMLQQCKPKDDAEAERMAALKESLTQ